MLSQSTRDFARHMALQAITPARAEFNRMLAERKAYPVGSPDHNYRTRAARQLVWMMRNIPVTEWTI